MKMFNLDSFALLLCPLWLLHSTGEHCLEKISRIKTIRLFFFFSFCIFWHTFLKYMLIECTFVLTLKYGEDDASRTRCAWMEYLHSAQMWNQSSPHYHHHHYHQRRRQSTLFQTLTSWHWYEVKAVGMEL